MKTTGASSPTPPRRRLRRILQLAVAAIILVFLIVAGPPVVFLGMVWLRDQGPEVAEPESGKGDYGRFDRNTPGEVVAVPADPKEAEKQLSALVARAGREKLKISVSGAKHSMGGHTLYPGGIALDMLPFHAMSLDETRKILTVGAGARWSEVIPYLDARGFAVDVMQSSNDFTVGGSLSVNCHGWQPHSPPICSTVESFRIVTADGAILRCSRTENAELFSLALGGYGLFGIILDAELRVVPNVFYSSKSYKVKPADYAALYEKLANGDPDVGLAYGRISVAPDSFLNDAFLVLLKKSPAAGPVANTLAPVKARPLERIVFRGSVGSDYGKNLRWRIESFVGGEAAGTHSRNQIMDEPSSWLATRDPEAVEILHEYFVPPAQLAVFVEKIRPILLHYQPDLLNITVRDVGDDHDTVLRYARGDMFGLVMLFHQHIDAKSDAAMEDFTREMIGAVLDCGGVYYLPYPGRTPRGRGLSGRIRRRRGFLRRSGGMIRARCSRICFM